jgi:hypothetical protein
MVNVNGRKAQADINWVYILIAIIFLITMAAFIHAMGQEGSSFGGGFVDFFKTCFGFC